MLCCINYEDDTSFVAMRIANVPVQQELHCIKDFNIIIELAYELLQKCSNFHW